MKVFEGALVLVPPGPIALTRDSNTTPVGMDVEVSGTLIRPLPPGAGLPSDCV
jgi:hypothetical protein